MIGNIGSATAPPGMPSAIKSPSDAYKITLTASGPVISFSVESPMPERFSLAMSAQWDSPFARSSANAAAGLVRKATGGRISPSPQQLSDALNAVGASSRFQVESTQVWQESSPFIVSLPLSLYAVDDPNTEIKEKVKQLLMLCAPSESGGLLTAPGPNVLGGGTQISVRIGNFLKMDKCIVRSVSADLEALIHTSGSPMIANVNVEVESHIASCTVNDLSGYFS